MGKQLGALCAAVLSVGLSGCAAAIASRSYDPNVAQDGIVYRLPATEVVVAATYELQECTPALKIGLVGVTLASRLTPSTDDADAFVIDPEALHTPLGSVGPARVELRNGMLASVGITTTSDVGALIGLAAKTASLVGSGTRTTVVANECSPRAIAARAAYTEAKNEQKRLEDALEAADARFRTHPSENLQRLVTRLDAQIAAAQAGVRTIRDTQIRRTVQFVCTPVINRSATPLRIGLQCTGAAPTWGQGPHAAEAAEAALAPSSANFRAWTTSEVTPERYQSLMSDVTVSLALIAAPAPNGGFAQRPTARTRRDGVFYRRPASGYLAIIPTNAAAASLAIDPTPVSLPQFGQLSFLEMRGASVGGRSIAVAFDETGAIKTYEYTSTGAAREIMTATAEAAQTLHHDEATDLQHQIDVLTRRRQLIEAQAALDAARHTGDDQTADASQH